MPLRTVRATRYVTPLREGGSMPAVIEADDDGMYVLKFRGAGQGLKALIAEVVAGEIARAAGLPIPEIVLVELDPDMARTEPDPEIQHLIRASAGLNLALDYLPGSVAFDPVVEQPDGRLASKVAWFDAYVSNVDRTARNTNLLIWHRKLWLIDHGAALYFHHAVSGPDEYAGRSRDRFAMIKHHVLLPFADALPEADAEMAAWLAAPFPPAQTAGMLARCARTASKSRLGSSAKRAVVWRSSSSTRASRKRRDGQETITPTLTNSSRSTRGTTRMTA